MESDSRIGEFFNKISDRLNDQQWFQELKAKWEELDPQSRSYLQYAAAGATGLALLFVIISSVLSVRSLKHEVAEKSELLMVIQTANDEIRKLRETSQMNGGGGAGDNAPWNSYFETLAATSGVDKSSFNVGAEKPGATTDTLKESLLDISLKHVNIKQVVRFAFAIENGARPTKLRNLTIDTQNDPNGYMDAVMSVSGFASKQ